MSQPKPVSASSALGGRLEGRVAIVTGGARGIGRAIVERFVAEGAAVVIADVSVEEGNAVAERLARTGGQVMFTATDVRKPIAVEALVNQALERFDAIDILCNNAGIGLLRSVIETTDDEYDLVLDTNLRSIFVCCRYVLPTMIARGRGNVINLGSVAGLVGFVKEAAYCASKGAVLALTRQMALDYASRGVRVNAICPAFVETEMMRSFISGHANPHAVESESVAMHPIGRVARPEEVAAVAAFLASDDSSFITGESIAVDGGLLARSGPQDISAGDGH